MYTESQLLSLLRNQPERGLTEIMAVYTSYVYTIVHGRLSENFPKQDIEECVGDVFYELYRTRASIDLDKGTLKAYIAVVAKRLAIRVFRRGRKHTGVLSINEVESDYYCDDGVSDRETRTLLLNEVELLGEPDSQIMLRKFYYGQSTKMIAAALGLKPNTVDKRVSRALAKLKQELGGVL